MTSLLSPIAEQNVGPLPGVDEDVEPDAQWKGALKARIEQGLQSMADKVRQERDAGLRGVREGSVEYDAVMQTYNTSMAHVRRVAEDQYNLELKIARFERSLALGKEIEGEEFEAFRRQQQAIWDKIKKDGADRPPGRRESTGGGGGGSSGGGGGGGSGGGGTRERENGEPVAVPPQASGEHDAREGPSVPYRDARPVARAPAPEYRPRDRTQSGGSDQIPGTPASYGSNRPPRSRGNSSVLAADVELPPGSPSPYDQTSIGRQGLSSLSRTRPQDIWLPSGPPPKEGLSATSRTFAHATSPGLSPVNPNVRDGYVNDAGGRTLSRSGSIRSNERPSPLDLDPGSSLPRDRFGMGSLDERMPTPSRKGKEADRPDPLQREPQQPMVYDYYVRRPDSRVAMPITPARPSLPTQSSDEPYFYQLNPGPSARPRQDSDDRDGIPVRKRSSRRSVPSDQGSPENQRYIPAGPASARPIPTKRSFTADFDSWQSHQSAPPTRPFFGPQSPPIPPTSASRPIPRPVLGTDDAPRRHSPSGLWHGSQSPPDAFPFAGYDLPYGSSSPSPRPRYPGSRRNSNGSRSVRSRSSRQEFWGPADVAPRALATFEEQSVASDDSGSEEDYGMGLDDLWRVRERQELAWKLIRGEDKAKGQEAIRMAEEAQLEARRKEVEARKREDEARKKAEEARMKEEEVRRRALEIKQKEEELRRREAELAKREVEAKLAEESRKRAEAEARLQDEIRKRREMEEEARRRELEERKRREREEAERREREEAEKRRQEREEAERQRREREEAEWRERERREWEERERKDRERRQAEERAREQREREERERRERDERARREAKEKERLEREAQREAREQQERERRAKEEQERREREEEARERREQEEARRRQLIAEAEAEEEARREAERLRSVRVEAQRLQVEAALAAEAEARAQAQEEARRRALEAQQEARQAQEEILRRRAAEAQQEERRRTVDAPSASSQPSESDPDFTDQLESPELIRQQQIIFEQIQAANRAKEEAKRRAEEARQRTAEEEERRRSEEEARQRADAETRRRIEAEQEGLRREREARRRAEEEYRKKEEEARKRENSILADVLRRSEEEHRRVEERRRQDSAGSTSEQARLGAYYASATSSAPRQVPTQGPSAYSGGASAGDRSSSASSSSYSSSASFFSAASGRSTSTGYSTSSGSRATATPTPSAPPTATPSLASTAKGAWKTPSKTATSPSTPSRSNTSSTYRTAFGSTSHAPSSSHSRSSTSQGVPPLSPEEWARRQEELAREQFEAFQREQDAQARRMGARAMKQLSKEEVIKLFEEHERRWTTIAALDVLSWALFPWPMLKPPSDPEQITYVEVQAYILSPHHPGDKAPKERIKDYLRRWHPDRFETKLLSKVREGERETVKEGAGAVARHLNKLLSSLSGSAENGLFG